MPPFNHIRRNGQKDDRDTWRTWGPYLSERQWGTVREDYSADGEAWNSLSHDQSRSVAYRWGEDGIGGWSDANQKLCFSLALWNGNDPILKERLFGVTLFEGNHGEDVKELYYYLDALPDYRYAKMLYKYPCQAFPYQQLIDRNQNRSKTESEYELIDTGIFDSNKYFDVFIEYAKIEADDILISITANNRGQKPAPLTLLPQLWFRNTWSWSTGAPRPKLSLSGSGHILAEHQDLECYHLYFESAGEALFTENETNLPLIHNVDQAAKYYKDAFHEYIVSHNIEAVNSKCIGTKAAIRFSKSILPGQSGNLKLRLSVHDLSSPFQSFEKSFEGARSTANSFYQNLQKDIVHDNLKRIQRQALAGLLWNKQYYYYNVRDWLKGDSQLPPPPPGRQEGRNSDWLHLNNADIISMPDKWEYPWYASWDLAFHCLPLALVDPEFAKRQLLLMTREWYMHPNGQLPAYEWDFSDVNPPVHAWATWRVYQIDRSISGSEGDIQFLERVFHKLMLNFTWWVNRKDADGRNLFQGGFLGLDNIGVFDRSKGLKEGAQLNQSDGTSWMAMYALNLMRIALELAVHNPAYEDIATKFFEHFLHIAEAMTNMGGTSLGLWDEEDEFYYDALQLPDGSTHPLKIRSLVGLIPLFAVETIEPELLEALPNFAKRLEWYLDKRPELASLVSHWEVPGRGKRRLLSLLRGHRLKCLLKRMLDETEFLSPYGVRSLSKVYKDAPYHFSCGEMESVVRYTPAESDSYLFGGNSNWRGPIWFPVNYLIIESLQKFHHYYGDEFKVECPTGSGNLLSIQQIAEELSRRLVSVFLPQDNGDRPVFGSNNTLQRDPHFKDNLLFYEYFDGDNGRGLGASHQTGWTALVAKMIQPRKDRTVAMDSFLFNCKSCIGDGAK